MSFVNNTELAKMVLDKDESINVNDTLGLQLNPSASHFIR